MNDKDISAEFILEQEYNGLAKGYVLPDDMYSAFVQDHTAHFQQSISRAFEEKDKQLSSLKSNLKKEAFKTSLPIVCVTGLLIAHLIGPAIDVFDGPVFIASLVFFNLALAWSLANCIKGTLLLRKCLFLRSLLVAINDEFDQGVSAADYPAILRLLIQTPGSHHEIIKER